MTLFNGLVVISILVVAFIIHGSIIASNQQKQIEQLFAEIISNRQEQINQLLAERASATKFLDN